MITDIQRKYTDLLNNADFLIQIPSIDNFEWYEVFKLKNKFYECEVLANGKCISIESHMTEPKTFYILYNYELNNKKK